MDKGICPACHSKQIRNRYGYGWDCRKCDARFLAPLTSRAASQAIEKWKRPDKSGLVKAPPTYAGLLCREILRANAEARAAVDGKRKGSYFGKWR